MQLKPGNSPARSAKRAIASSPTSRHATRGRASRWRTWRDIAPAVRVERRPIAAETASTALEIARTVSFQVRRWKPSGFTAIDTDARLSASTVPSRARMRPRGPAVRTVRIDWRAPS